MKYPKSRLKLYQKKMNAPKDLEAVKAAFANSYAICFAVDRGYLAAKHALFADFWGQIPMRSLQKRISVFFSMW